MKIPGGERRESGEARYVGQIYDECRSTGLAWIFVIIDLRMVNRAVKDHKQRSRLDVSVAVNCALDLACCQRRVGFNGYLGPSGVDRGVTA